MHPCRLGVGAKVPSGGGGHGGKGSHGAGIEMLTDTEGVDFNDYFRRIYYIVKGNWEAVMPPSVSLGEQGVVSLHVKIMRDGSVPDPEPVMLYGSGKEPLDRAAVSSIRASNPFPPLPGAVQRAVHRSAVYVLLQHSATEPVEVAQALLPVNAG